jgi:hypothetical protein
MDARNDTRMNGLDRDSYVSNDLMNRKIGFFFFLHGHETSSSTLREYSRLFENMALMGIFGRNRRLEKTA